MSYDLRLLQYAVALGEHRNFARAAKALHIAQPTLSRGIKNLETQCGSQLFDRTSTGADLTDAGILFLTHARDLLARSDDLKREMNLLAGLETGDLRIGAGTYPSHMCVDRAVCRMVREHPGVQISVTTDNWASIIPALRKREIELAVIDVTAAENSPEMEITKLAQHQGYFVFRSGHPLLRSRDKRPMEDAWNFPIVSTSRFPQEVFRGLAEAMAASVRSKPPRSKTIVTIACESLPMMKTIAMETDAVALLPLHLVIEEIKACRVQAVPVPTWIKGNFGIARLAHRSLSPLGEAFVRLLQEEDAALLRWEEETTKELFELRSRPATASR
jgi:DNA-binding transcriptional LysR family regulator